MVHNKHQHMHIFT